MRRLHLSLTKLLAAALLLPALTACNAYRMKTPSGFAEVEKSDWGAHYKGSNNVGLRVATFENVKGGSLAFWSEDLVRKLGARGYELTGQAPAKSANGLPGTRFDFDYQPPGEDTAARKYSVILFVSDKHRVVMQMAGEADILAAAGGQLDTIASATKVRGCRAWTDICKSPQPGTLSTPPKKQKKEKTPTTTEIAEGQTAPQGG